MTRSGLPARYRGNLFVCDWGRQSVVCFEIRKAGGTFAVARQTAVVSKGSLADFHPVAACRDGRRNRLLGRGLGERGLALPRHPRPARLYRLTYSGADRVSPTPRPSAQTLWTTRSRRSITRLFPSGLTRSGLWRGRGSMPSGA